jgi:hypothetical protein
MEQDRQPGTPVNLSALLIGERTVPKGCRVMHVSSHGMLLHCEADGRPRTFSDGDSVDIHLTVLHNGEQKKLTIPSHVRHVAENSLDVEFQHPDPVLLDLIESYRTSEEHTLEAIVGDTRTCNEDSDVIPLPGTHAHQQPAARKEPDNRSGQSGRRSGIISGLIVLLCMVALLATAFLYTRDLHSRVGALELNAGNRDSELADMQNRLFSASLLEGKYASLDARISALGNAIANLEQHVQTLFSGNSANATRPGVAARTPGQTSGTQAPSASKPAKFSGTVIRSTSEAGTPDNTARKPAQLTTPRNATTRSPAATQPTAVPPALSGQQATETGQPVSPATQASGPWAINLMSSLDRQYLESVARRAQSADIPTVLTSAKVKGKLYWRLQVTGFRSLAEAKARASVIQQSLGIEDVWFLKRKPVS